ncbi:MAG: endopeptidase La [Deltaproteobacteria bacterium]|nr:endopeptidase La [Deltaproteobacteria bacterium]
MSANSVQLLPDRLNLLLLHRIVIFPMLSVTITVHRQEDIELLLKCHEQNLLLGVANFNRPESGPLTYERIYPTGTACRVTRATRTGRDGLETVLEGVCRISFLRLLENQHPPQALIAGTHENLQSNDSLARMLMESCAALLRSCCAAGQPLPEAAMNLIDRINHPGHLADLIVIYLQPDFPLQQQALALINPGDRLKLVHQLLYDRRAKLEHNSRSPENLDQRPWPKIAGGMTRPDSDNEELAELKKKIESLNLDPQTQRNLNKELQRLERMNPSSPDYQGILSYIEYLAELPWLDEDQDNLDLNQAEKILDEDHFGLEKVKERILEHLAVRQLNRAMKGPIICLLGPPGVGKTSLGKSIARAMGRKFIRVSLGGVHDEAEIRGHRRTYLGAMPGKIIQEIKRARSRRPVFMLDEIDKLGRDFRGDPASALLEVMDPEQNNNFVDHYINLPFDLSQTMFIATANQSDPIPAPLLDRMEIITLPGYSEEEKKIIACRYLLDRQAINHGLQENKIALTDEALDTIIDSYTRESGVRNLEKMIGRIMRKCARAKVAGQSVPKTITERSLTDFLGPARYRKEAAAARSRVGIVTGLAWTSTGGDILFIEAALMESKKEGSLTLTGSLGEVMKESALTALSYLRSLSPDYGLEMDFFDRHLVHIHIPSGSIPKDGPSAGLAIFLTLLSLASGRNAEHRLAVTGEISLSGRVLPVGGIKEKVLAARRAGLEKIILPRENLKDLEDLPAAARNQMTFYGITQINEAVPLAIPSLSTIMKKQTLNCPLANNHEASRKPPATF